MDSYTVTNEEGGVNLRSLKPHNVNILAHIRNFCTYRLFVFAGFVATLVSLAKWRTKSESVKYVLTF